ncbi:MAG: helix-turn-helix domain-containing protein [Ginsengibacter sp.]
MENHRSGCPVNLMLEIFGDKWSLIIIRDIMFNGKRYFGELLHSEEKIASNILSDRLAMLEREGIISKANDPAHKQKNIYSLTEKGIDLLPVMVEIGGWSIKHKPVDLKKHKHAKDLVKSGKDGLVQMRKNLVNEHIK